MGREQFLQTRAGNWSKVAMWHLLLVLGKSSSRPNACSGLIPHTRLGNAASCVQDYCSL
jgi:hypothetical protein